MILPPCWPSDSTSLSPLVLLFASCCLCWWGSSYALTGGSAWQSSSLPTIHSQPGPGSLIPLAAGVAPSNAPTPSLPGLSSTLTLPALSSAQPSAQPCTVREPSVPPPQQWLPHASVGGHWRHGADAAPFVTPGGGGTPICAAYGYQPECCVPCCASNCEGFSSAYVLNDGSPLLSLGSLAPLLPPGKRLLVMGDSLGMYLGYSVNCLVPGAEGSSANEVTLPSGGTLLIERKNHCETGPPEGVALSQLEAYFATFDVIVVNFDARYESLGGLRACMEQLLPMLARVNGLGGKAAVLVDSWPGHFPTADGDYARGRTWPPVTRSRGPSAYVGNCVPHTSNLLSSRASLIGAMAAAQGVPVAEVSRVMKANYAGHLHRSGGVDCLHVCYARDLFAPLWDAVVRRALGVLHPPAAAAGGGGGAAGLLLLDFGALCPALQPVLAVATRPHLPAPLNRTLTVAVTGGLPALRAALSNTSSSQHSLPLLHLTVAPCASAAVTVLLFVDVLYADLQVEAGKVQEAYLASNSSSSSSSSSAEGPQRYGSESVFVGQELVACCREGQGQGQGQALQWNYSLALQRHPWLLAGIQHGDGVRLRAVACEAAVGGEGGEGRQPMCQREGALGCDSFELFAVLPYQSHTAAEDFVLPTEQRRLALQRGEDSLFDLDL